MHDGTDHGAELLRLYDSAVGEVYGYLHHRGCDIELAKELTAETFLAAVGQIRRGGVEQVSTAWLIGIARHKLADHWRRRLRRERLAPMDHDGAEPVEDPWDVVVDTHRVGDVLDQLAPHHRAALTLRYLDGLAVPEVADHLHRTVHATEALLVRARRAFRTIYEDPGA